jgi:hypothetical protein
MTVTGQDLVNCADPMVWAEAFVQTVLEHPQIPYDVGTMVGWFANAMESTRTKHPTWEEHEEARRAGKLFDPCGPGCPKPTA